MNRSVPLLVLFALASAPANTAEAQWPGLRDESSRLQTVDFSFSKDHRGGNENYYDGDFGDFDGDGLPDRLLGSRYGLLFNTGGGRMIEIRRNVGMLLRGDPGASGWGEDAMTLADVDGDGDLDALSGGNGEPLSCQINERWRFRTEWSVRGNSALNIIPTDVEQDGDVDLFVAHSFCREQSCGGPVDFALLINDGSGNFVEETRSRGFNYSNSDHIVGVVAGDIDGDGDFDALLQHGTPSQTYLDVAINNGSGSFSVRQVPFVIGGSGFSQNMALGDIDDDGDLDLLIGKSPHDNLRGKNPRVAHVLATNDGSGHFTERSDTLFDASGWTKSLALGGADISLVDIDYDGDLDIVGFRALNTDLGTNTHHLQVYLNNGSGRMVYADAHSPEFSGRTQALGVDVDISDLDGDGDYDVWVGVGGDIVRIFLNQQQQAGSAPLDMPEGFRVVQENGSGVTLGWKLPTFAAAARRYRIYRSLAPGLHDRDRTMIAELGQSRFLDIDFYGTIDRHSTNRDLGHPSASIDRSSGELRFVDTTAVPGVHYWYTVAHVGPEHNESAHAPELLAKRSRPAGSDNTGPELEIVSPVSADWMRFPRIVVGYGDGQSGVDKNSLSISFDAPLGTVAAGTNIASMAYRHDDTGFIAALAPPHALPNDRVVTMTASIQDKDGNTTTKTVRFFVNILPAQTSSPKLPSADFSASAASGAAPLTVDFDASGSDDPDGAVMRWEWYFGDGSTSLGRELSHTFQYGGSYPVTLLVRDNEGGVATTTRTIDVSGEPPPPDAGVPGVDAGVPGTDGGIGPGDGGGDLDGSVAPSTEKIVGGCAVDGAAGPIGTLAWGLLLLGWRKKR